MLNIQEKLWLTSDSLAADPEKEVRRFREYKQKSRDEVISFARNLSKEPFFNFYVICETFFFLVSQPFSY